LATISKNELIAALAEKTGTTKADAGTAINATLDIIADALAQGGEVKLAGFGAFSVSNRAAREGRDPRTGQPVQIAASKAAKFSAAKALKDSVNAK